MSTLLLRGLSLYLHDPMLRSFYPEYTFSGIDPLNKMVNIFFFNRFNPILASNLLILLYLFLALTFSFVFFRSLIPDTQCTLVFNRLSNRDMISGFFALFFSFSPFFLFRISSLTFNLFQIFFFPLTLLFLIKSSKTKVSPYLFSIMLCFFMFYSSYYAYMTALLVIFWKFAEILIDRSVQEIKHSLLFLFKIFVPVTVFVFLVYRNLIISNVPLLGNYRLTETTPDPRIETLYRPIEDYYNFSFRPWYFLIPPKTSLLFGDLSKKVYDYLESTNYYLASNYDNAEAGGSYLGWHLIFGYLFALFVGLEKVRNKFPKLNKFENLISNKILIQKMTVVAILILLISHPPSFTISGIEIFTPSYILYKFFPFFRVLVRWSIVLYLLTLCVNVFLVLDIYKLIKRDYLKISFIVLFSLVHFALMSIKLPLIDMWRIPPEILYISRATKEEKVKFVVYPEGDFYSVFWTLRHKNYFYNVPQIKTAEYKPAEFSNNILTSDGLSQLKINNIKYVLYYKNAKNKYIPNDGILDESQISPTLEGNFGNIVYSDENVEIFESIN